MQRALQRMLGRMELHEDRPVQVVMGIKWRAQPWFHSDLSHDRRVTDMRPPGEPGGSCRCVPPPQLRFRYRLRLRGNKNTVKRWGGG